MSESSESEGQKKPTPGRINQPSAKLDKRNPGEDWNEEDQVKQDPPEESTIHDEPDAREDHPLFKKEEEEVESQTRKSDSPPAFVKARTITEALKATRQSKFDQEVERYNELEMERSRLVRMKKKGYVHGCEISPCLLNSRGKLISPRQLRNQFDPLVVETWEKQLGREKVRTQSPERIAEQEEHSFDFSTSSEGQTAEERQIESEASYPRSLDDFIVESFGADIDYGKPSPSPDFAEAGNGSETNKIMSLEKAVKLFHELEVERCRLIRVKGKQGHLRECKVSSCLLNSRGKLINPRQLRRKFDPHVIETWEKLYGKEKFRTQPRERIMEEEEAVDSRSSSENQEIEERKTESKALPPRSLENLIIEKFQTDADFRRFLKELVQSSEANPEVNKKSQEQIVNPEPEETREINPVKWEVKVQATSETCTVQISRF